MPSPKSHKKQSVKQMAKKHATKTSTAPYPSLITQVSKDDEDKKQTMMSFSGLYKCCSYLWKCVSPKKEEEFSPINDNNGPVLLGPQPAHLKGRKVLVLDLDETLVHSTFEPVKKADIVLPVHLNGQTYKINVLIRPGCEEFLARVKEQFEVVVFTASLPEYAEPLVKKIDPTGSITSLLFRQHCTPMNGVYVKDMSILGRDIKDIILVDNSPNSFIFQPENAYHIKNFFDDKSDRELVRLTAFLDNILEAEVDDVRPIADLRQRYEPKDIEKLLKFVKTTTTHPTEQEADQEQSGIEMNPVTVNIAKKASRTSLLKKKDEREKVYTIETEPAIRRGRDEPEEITKGALTDRGTERGTSSDIKKDDQEDSSETEIEMGLPSPKESDNLINHREAEADGYYDNNNSNETDENKLQKRRSSAHYKGHAPDFVTVEERIIDGQKIDTVRFLNGGENLNSPLGRHVKIEFNNKKNEVDQEQDQDQDSDLDQDVEIDL